MICEKCGKNQATTHIKTNINGVVQSYHLCAECAAKSQYAQQQLGLNELLGSLFGETLKAAPSVDKRKRCEQCGICFDEIAKSGRVGCDKCYETFLDQLLPSLQRMHGKAKHAGKRPNSVPLAETVPEKENEIEKLQAELKKAIDEENFELAAKLRDEIKEKKEVGENE